MIRFCDKAEYVIHLGEMTRSQMLQFFLNRGGEHRFDIITILDEHENYYGIVTYQRVLEYKDENMVINRDFIKITNSFWEEARKFFAKNPNELLPVADNGGNVLGFCYNDRDSYDEIDRILKTFGERHESLPVPLSKWNKLCQVVCITDINELAWGCYKLFAKMGFPVIVIGEKWEWFGIKTMEGYNDWPDYAKLYIYAEGIDCFRIENDHNKSRYGSVYKNFTKIFFPWAEENMKVIYYSAIHKLISKGVSVCVGRMPKINEIEYYTPLEKDGMLQPNNEKIQEKLIGRGVNENLQRGIIVEREGWKRVDYRCYYGESCVDVVYDKRIYLIGPCIVNGGVNLLQDTLPALCQRLVEKEKYLVVRIVSMLDFFITEYDIEQIPIKKHDIVIFIERGHVWGDAKDLEWINNKGGTWVDFRSLYNDPQRESWFHSREPIHTNRYGNIAIAKELYKAYLKDEIQRKQELLDGNEYIQKGEVLSEELREKVKNYVEQVRSKEAKDGTIGSIVMNCNPFTLGHRYLIEYAASKVDWLYIFVVEEDKSTFCFEDRIRLVKQGTDHLNNVVVVPSGDWVLSYQTMPIYFEKSQRKEERVDATMDLEIFARYIAPQLGISIRFVGEEPIDEVTRQYNEQMKKVLGGFGIEVEEIERKRYQGEVISASAVRRFVEEEKWDMVQKYVPETTYQYLKKR